MTRITPSYELFGGYPCSYVAVNSALLYGGRCKDYAPTELPDGLRSSDGYLTLNGNNKYVRKHLPVRKRRDFKRGERPKLKDLHLEGSAIVVVYGHCIYVDGETYWSFFDNEEDEVVAVWELA